MRPDPVIDPSRCFAGRTAGRAAGSAIAEAVGIARRSTALAVTAVTMLAGATVHAQQAAPRDGVFRAAVGLGASLADGNTRSRHLALSADAVRATELDRTTLTATAQYARNDGTTSADRLRLGARQDRELGRELFAFGALDLERNRFVNLSLRSQLGAGLGRHLLRSATTTWDVFGGLAWTHERFRDPMVIGGAQRDSWGYGGLLLGEESMHRLSDSTLLRQRLTMVPNLREGGEFRANWDAGLAVAMNRSLSLNVGLSYAYNSEPGLGRKTTDTLLTTGLAIRLE
jgi:putative salt-induced outer membrane protein YdiY